MVRTAAIRAAACAMACTLAGCGPQGTTVPKPQRPVDDPDAPRREPFIVTESPGISLIATNASHLYWIDEAGLRRRPLGGADAGTVELMAEVTEEWAKQGALLVVGDRAYVFGDTKVGSVSLAQKGSTLELISEMPGHISAFTIGSNGDVYIATEGSVLKVAAGVPPVVFATGQLGIVDVIVDDAYLYWDTDGTDPNTPQPQPTYYQPTPTTLTGGLYRVSRKGGPIQELALDQAVPGALALGDGRLWWCNPYGPAAVQSMPVDGSATPTVDVAGRAETLAVDAGGIVYRQIGGMMAERRGDAIQVHLIPDGTWTLNGPNANAIGTALSPEWVYVAATRNDTSNTAILALPRQQQAVQVAFDLTNQLVRLADDNDGTVYWTETSREGDGITHIMRGDPDTGERKELADYEGYVSELVVAAGQVYFDDSSVISSVSVGGGPIKTFDRPDSGWLTGLTVHRNYIYWTDGSALWAKKRRGGTAFVMARNENNYGYGYGYGDGGAEMVFDDDFVYLTSFGSGGSGLYQVSEQGRVRLLWDGSSTSSTPGKDLVLLGDELFFTASPGSGGTIYKVTSDGEATALYRTSSDGYSNDLVAGGGMLYYLSTRNDIYEVTRIDPSTGEASAVLRYAYAGDYPGLTADDNALYVALDGYDALVRIAHDAPAVPDMGWPAKSE